MILSDRDIRRDMAKTSGHRLVFNPPLLPAQIQTSTINLRVGDRFVKLRFRKEATARATLTHIRLDQLSDYRSVEKDYGEEFLVAAGQRFILEPNTSALAWTYEKIVIPPYLAGRIEGRSSLARIGLTIHNTAPTIHPGFGYSPDGKAIGYPVCLELTNQREDLAIEILPGSIDCCLSQLILEKVSSVPSELYFRRGQFRPPAK